MPCLPVLTNSGSHVCCSLRIARTPFFDSERGSPSTTHISAQRFVFPCSPNTLLACSCVVPSGTATPSPPRDSSTTRPLSSVAWFRAVSRSTVFGSGVTRSPPRPDPLVKNGLAKKPSSPLPASTSFTCAPSTPILKAAVFAAGFPFFAFSSTAVCTSPPCAFTHAHAAARVTLLRLSTTTYLVWGNAPWCCFAPAVLCTACTVLIEHRNRRSVLISSPRTVTREISGAANPCGLSAGATSTPAVCACCGFCSASVTSLRLHHRMPPFFLKSAKLAASRLSGKSSARGLHIAPATSSSAFFIVCCPEDPIVEGGGLFGGRGGAVGMCSGLIFDSLCPPGKLFSKYFSVRQCVMLGSERTTPQLTQMCSNTPYTQENCIFE